MVFQQNIQIIIMLTELYDGTREKCAQYWPEIIGDTRSYVVGGGYTSNLDVTLLEEKPFYSPLDNQKICFFIRKIKVTYENSSMIVTQTNYLAWPDHGVPDVTDDFLYLVEYIMKLRNEVDGKNEQQLPVCVHCSAGIGRTGVFISVETAVNQIKQLIPLDPKKVLEQMREQRPQMVQKAEQYHFANESIIQWYDRNIQNLV